MSAVGLTDHGSMAGAVELSRAAAKVGIKPILGCEVYVVDDHAARVQKERRAHLTLLAETTAGYHNLVRLVSAAYLDGYWYRPRDRPRAARHARRGDHRALGMPVGPRLQGTGGRRRGPRPPGARHTGRDLRPRPGVRRAAGRRHRHPDAHQPPAGRPGRRRGPATRRHGRCPLPDRGRRHPARGAAVHPDERHARQPEPVPVLEPRLLPQEPRGDVRADGAAVGRGHAPPDGRDRRSLQRAHRAGRAAPAQVRRPRRQDARSPTCASWPRPACASATAPRRPSCAPGSSSSCARSRRWASRTTS